MTPQRASLSLAACLALAAFAGPVSAKTTAAAATPKPRAMVLPFIENDYTRAVAQARASKKPIFVEAWAPW